MAERNEPGQSSEVSSSSVYKMDLCSRKKSAIIEAREEFEKKLNIKVPSSSGYKMAPRSRKKAVIIEARTDFEEKLNIKESSFQHTLRDIRCGRASLHVPAGALAEQQQADKISLDVYDGDDYPPIDDDHLMITPVISCSPDGLTFNQPAELTIPHCIPMHYENEGDPIPINKSDVEAIQLWYRSPQKEWQKVPSVKTGDPSQPSWLKAMTRSSIILEVASFSDYCASTDTKSTRHIRLYMQPSQITENTQSIKVFVYAVQKSFLQKVQENEKHKASVVCASENEIDITPNQKSLKITLRDIFPTSKWIPLTIEQHIPYRKLQKGNTSTRCEFQFSRMQSAVNPETLRGYFDAEQEDNDDYLRGFIFDIDMFPAAGLTTDISAERSFQPKSFDIYCGNASLHVPAGALAEQHQADGISLALYDGDDYPPIDADHLMITPIISCSPDALTFKQPAQLTIPHCIPMQQEKDGDPRPNNKSDAEAIQLWYRSPKKVWQKVPSVKTGDLKQPCWLKEINPESIILEVNGFTGYGLSANRPCTRHIILYMQPSQITGSTESVNVFVYAVMKSQLKRIKKREESKAHSVMCADKNEIAVKPNKKNLKITLRDIRPNSWDLTKPKHIPYAKLQTGTIASKCDFKFTRSSSAGTQNTINGWYDAEQEENEENNLVDFIFDIKMFQAVSADHSLSNGDDVEQNPTHPGIPQSDLQTGACGGADTTVIAKKVVDMKYDLESPTKNEIITRKVTIDLSHYNETNVLQELEANVTDAEEMTDTFEWSWKSVTAVKADAKLTIGIPCVGEIGLTTGFQQSFWIGSNKGSANTKTRSICTCIKLSAEPGKKTKVDATIYERHIETKCQAIFDDGKYEWGTFKCVRCTVEAHGQNV